jgi:uncharacterized membrane protein YeaQ/YmgE (transglycosylase-associated protein family)
MVFVTGFLIWLAFGVIAAFVMRAMLPSPETTTPVSFLLAIFGAFIGGMLGVSAYVYHDPFPTRFGGLLGALIGAFLFCWIYHFAARKAV